MSARIDRDNQTIRLSSYTERAIRESSHELRIAKIGDGRLDISLEESSKKFDGKRWHTDRATICLTAEQKAELIAWLTA